MRYCWMGLITWEITMGMTHDILFGGHEKRGEKRRNGRQIRLGQNYERCMASVYLHLPSYLITSLVRRSVSPLLSRGYLGSTRISHYPKLQ